MEARDQHTLKHSLIVAQKAYELAGSLDLVPEDMFLAGLLHDIGKIAMGDDILKSSRRLSSGEKYILNEHVIEGFNILKESAFSYSTLDFCLYHHERLNGKGYPYGVQDIPLEGRLAAVVDVYSALSLPRKYHPKNYKQEEVIEVMLNEQRETQGYDAYILSMLINNVERHLHYGHIHNSMTKTSNV
ncbi:HD-GYP domain-containing protein [Pontibacillus yanchengensis]|uniref:HD-GYP domain-containing protein n=1 Tax=Pontibacillus yanchengensis TaxID=462910 RepID=UPI00136999F6|nr:HD domain-containing phosphohydrolase [Pontibacillus yanchengensis]